MEMDTHHSFFRSSKKKHWINNPSTSILRNIDFKKLGVFAVTAGPRIGFAFSVDQDEKLIIGSGSKANIQLDCRGISRKHCCVYWKDSDLYVEDLNSTNGTKVNNRKIKSPTKISIGDRIAIGATTVIKRS